MTARMLLSIAIVVPLAAPPVASAAKLSKPMRDVQAPSEPARPQPARPRHPATPKLTVEEFLGAQRARIQDISDKQIVYLQRLIALASPHDSQMPDYRFRLGDLLSERQRTWSHRARAKDEPIFRAQQSHDTAGAAQLRQERERAQQVADRALREAVAQLVAAAEHPRYGRADEVLYRLGYLLELGGHPERARAVYRRLLKQHPGSRYVPHAYLSFAEQLFATGDMAQALAFYDKAAHFPTSPVFGFALYKKAWCQANLGDDKAALATFVEVLGHCQGGTIHQAQREPLGKEARRDLVRVFARIPGGAPRAWDFFVRVGGSEAPRMMQTLAESYWEGGRAADSSRVYHKLMTLEPHAPQVCAWQDRVLRNTLSAGSEADQVQELRRLGASYRSLRQRGEVKTDVLGECRQRYHDAARELAFVLHKQAQRLRQLPTFELAAAAYDELTGPDPAAVPAEVAFYHAECLWQIAALVASDEARWRAAAEQYGRVVRLDPGGPYGKEAAYAAVLAWQNVVYANDDDLHPRRRGS